MTASGDPVGEEQSSSLPRQSYLLASSRMSAPHNNSVSQNNTVLERCAVGERMAGTRTQSVVSANKLSRCQIKSFQQLL